jgi:hypothetical protein
LDLNIARNLPPKLTLFLSSIRKSILKDRASLYIKPASLPWRERRNRRSRFSGGASLLRSCHASRSYALSRCCLCLRYRSLGARFGRRHQIVKTLVERPLPGSSSLRKSLHLAWLESLTNPGLDVLRDLLA